MTVNSSETAAFEPARRIRAILPDDGSDRRLLEGLWRDKGVTRADTVPVRAVAALLEAHTRRGRLPEPVLARLVTVIVSPAEADGVFDYIYATARVGRPGGGTVLMDRLSGATVYKLPPDSPNSKPARRQRALNEGFQNRQVTGDEANVRFGSL